MSTDDNGERVDIGDGITIPVTVSGRIRDESAGWDAWIKAAYDPEVGRYRVRSLTVDVVDDEQEVTGELIRSVRVAALLRDAVTRAFTEELWPLVAGGPGAPDGFERHEVTGPTTETLRLVALVYRLALLTGDAPTKTVAERLEVTRSTAGRWVTRARDRGLLTVADPRASRLEA